MPANANNGRSELSANQIGVFFGLVSAHSLKEVAGTKHLELGPSHRRQWGLAVLRILVMGVPRNCMGTGIPQRISVSSRSPVLLVRTTGARLSGKTAGNDGRLPAESTVARIKARILAWESVIA
jgi:hypothetical protein